MQCIKRDDLEMVVGKVGTPTNSTDLEIVPDKSRTAQGIYVVL